MKLILNTIYKSKLLFKSKIYYCQIGSNGIAPIFKKQEGDKRTPLGKWKLLKIYLRKDKKLNLRLKKHIRKKIILIKKKNVWCDDPSNIHYNKLVNLKKIKNNSEFSYENLFRQDDVYDIVIELNYNKNPIIKNKGSAIFIHCSFDDLRPTLGCVALKKKYLKYIINNLQTKNYIYIR